MARKHLENMSIEELEEYAVELKAEEIDVKTRKRAVREMHGRRVESKLAAEVLERAGLSHLIDDPDALRAAIAALPPREGDVVVTPDTLALGIETAHLEEPR